MRSAGLLCVVLICCTAPLFAENTDVMILKSGGRIIGEIRKMDRGKLTCSTDEMQTVYIDWMEIARISSPQVFDIRMSTGLRYQGSFGESAEDGKVEIVTEAGRSTVGMISVVQITPLDARFWRGFKGSLSLGFNLQKANSLKTLTSSADITYHTRSWETRLTTSNYVSDRDEVDKIARNSVSLVFNKYLAKLWSVLSFAQFQHNDELNLDQRFIFGASGGKYIIKNNRMELMGLAGLTLTNELYTGEESSKNSLVALFAFAFQAYRYRDPDLNFTADIQIYPSITDFGRVRIEFNSSIFYEIFNNFYATLSLIDVFDSRPPTEVTDAVKNDYGIDLSLSFKFH